MTGGQRESDATYHGPSSGDDQRAFDTIYRHLIAQGEASMDGMQCLYRMGDGRKCAIGALIYDEVYTLDLEERNVSDPDVLQAVRDSGWDVSRQLLIGAQEIHDRYPPSEWDARLRALARRYRLDVPSLDR